MLSRSANLVALCLLFASCAEKVAERSAKPPPAREAKATTHSSKGVCRTGVSDPNSIPAALVDVAHSPAEFLGKRVRVAGAINPSFEMQSIIDVETKVSIPIDWRDLDLVSCAWKHVIAEGYLTKTEHSRAPFVLRLYSMTDARIDAPPPPRVSRDDAAGYTAPRSFANMQVLPLNNGPNAIDLDADGHGDMVFVAQAKDDANRGIDVLTFYIWHAPNKGPFGTWAAVPLTSGPEVLYSTTRGNGGQCTTKDIRLLRPKAANLPVSLIVASRPPGTAPRDHESVTFTVYRLVKADSSTDREPFVFEAQETILAKNEYCNVNQAFLDELELPRFVPPSEPAP